jgi:hypothetical protein
MSRLRRVAEQRTLGISKFCFSKTCGWRSPPHRLVRFPDDAVRLTRKPKSRNSRHDQGKTISEIVPFLV